MKIKKSILLTVLGLAVLLGGLIGIKGLQIKTMIAHGESFVPPPETVTTSRVNAYSWESVLTAVGSLEAVQGVLITAELPGKVTHIGFESGTSVTAGTVLLQQDISEELAEQSAAESELVLARKNYERARSLLPGNVISRSDFDAAKTQFEKAASRVAAIGSAIEKKTIRAPFSARLGIRQVSLGEVLEVGQPIVSLQTVDPIYVNFPLPQNQLSRIRTGLPVRVVSDTLEAKAFNGTITAINAEVDSTTRNVRIQATLGNPDAELHTGMYAHVTVILPDQNPVIAIPATAVLYAPYSDSVFVVEDKTTASGSVVKTIRQQFVKLGETHGDYIAVQSGVTLGDTVVSTGVFKLRNGQAVVIDNADAPTFHSDPRPDNA